MSHQPEPKPPPGEDDFAIVENEDDFTIIENEYRCEWDEDFQSKYNSPPRNAKEKALTMAKNAAGLVKDKVTAAAPSEEDVAATAKHIAEVFKDGLTVAVVAAADATSKAAKSDIAVQGKATALRIAAAASANVKKAILGSVPLPQNNFGNECPPDIITFDSDGEEWRASEGLEMDEATKRREQIQKEWLARPEGGRNRDPKREHGGPELWVNGAQVASSGTKTRTSHGLMHTEDGNRIEVLQDALAQGLDDEFSSQLKPLRRSSI